MRDDEVLVLKCNLDGQETWRYTGTILERSENRIRLEAFFNRDDVVVHGIHFRCGDRFIETFYNDRWYNIFEIHDRDDNTLKGWYCNICKPARFTAEAISYVDLALDLLVYPNGRQLLLDEDEFEEMDLPKDTREAAINAVDVLRSYFLKKFS